MESRGGNRGRPGGLGRLAHDPIGQRRGNRWERLLANRSVVANVRDREIGPILRKPSRDLRLVVFGRRLLLPDGVCKVVDFLWTEGHLREDIGQAGLKIPQLPRGIDRHPGLSAGRGHRHERLEPGVLEPVPVLVVGETCPGEDRSGGRGIPGPHEVLELALRHLDRTGHIASGDPGRGVERGE